MIWMHSANIIHNAFLYRNILFLTQNVYLNINVIQYCSAGCLLLSLLLVVALSINVMVFSFLSLIASLYSLLYSYISFASVHSVLIIIIYQILAYCIALFNLVKTWCGLLLICLSIFFINFSFFFFILLFFQFTDGIFLCSQSAIMYLCYVWSSTTIIYSIILI